MAPPTIVDIFCGCCRSEKATLSLKALEFALDEYQVLELADIMKYLGLTWNEVLDPAATAASTAPSIWRWRSSLNILSTIYTHTDGSLNTMYI
jgi:hypothetical protein